MTKSMVEKDAQKTSSIKFILSEAFSPSGILSQEMDCYNSLLESSGLDQYTAEKMIFHCRRKHELLDHKKIFEAQSDLIKKINSELTPQVYQNFVPNYRSYATIAQVFSSHTPIKRKVLMERNLIGDLMKPLGHEKPMMENISSLVVNKYIERFNNKYDYLMTEQKVLLSKYILAVGDNRADFTVYLSEELSRIRSEIVKSLSLEEVKNDNDMIANTKKLLEQIDSFNISEVDESTLLKLLKLQTLVVEYKNDD